MGRKNKTGSHDRLSSGGDSMRTQKAQRNQDTNAFIKEDNPLLHTKLFIQKKRSGSSFRTRLILSFVLLIALTFGVGGTLLISTSFYSLLEEEKQAAIYEYETIQSNLMMLISLSDDGGDYNNMSLSLKQMREQNIAHWQAISLTSKGYALYESGNLDLLLMDDLWKNIESSIHTKTEQEFIEETERTATEYPCNLAITGENSETEQNQENTIHTTIEYYDAKHHNVKNAEKYLYRHIIDENDRYLQMYSELSTGKETLYLKAAFDLSSAYELRERQQKLFLFVYMAVVVLGFGVASIIAYLLTRRLQSLTTAVREITDGNLAMRTNLRTGDEFEQLSRDFDSMTDKLQENIRKLEDDVERQEAFMGAVAHELKTPMTSIIGYADFIRQCALDEEERMMAANYIYTEGQRLEKLSHKILDLLLMEKDNFIMKEVDLDAFLGYIVNTLLPVAKEKGIELHLECEPMKIWIEPDLGKSLMYNLIDNAMKATPSGGRVYIHAHMIQSMREAKKVDSHVIQETKKADSYMIQEAKNRNCYIMQGGCEIKVTDTGCGIEEKEIKKLTEAFYRVDKSRSRMQGGVGLGLTLCKKIVDLHHGNMTFQSKEGKGTCVTVELFW